MVMAPLVGLEERVGSDDGVRRRGFEEAYGAVGQLQRHEKREAGIHVAMNGGAEGEYETWQG